MVVARTLIYFGSLPLLRFIAFTITVELWHICSSEVKWLSH